MREKIKQFFESERFFQFLDGLMKVIEAGQRIIEMHQREEALRTRYKREARIVQLANARARERLLPATLLLSEWLATLEKYRYCCAYCGEPYEELEHIVPLHHGTKGTTQDNCVPACRECNVVKGRHHPDLLKRVSDGIERVRHEQSSNNA
jgi:5-methylcytosine-specific restriction endonuclease McrA